MGRAFSSAAAVRRIRFPCQFRGSISRRWSWTACRAVTICLSRTANFPRRPSTKFLQTGAIIRTIWRRGSLRTSTARQTAAASETRKFSPLRFTARPKEAPFWSMCWTQILPTEMCCLTAVRRPEKLHLLRLRHRRRQIFLLGAHFKRNHAVLLGLDHSLLHTGCEGNLSRAGNFPVRQESGFRRGLEQQCTAGHAELYAVSHDSGGSAELPERYAAKPHRDDHGRNVFRHPELKKAVYGLSVTQRTLFLKNRKENS